MSLDNQLRLDVEPRFARLEEPLLTPADAARLLVVKTSWIYEAVRDGRLPCVRIGRHIRFLRSDLERFVDGRRDAPRPT
jgi:excisionase family DNA binding protein